MDYYLRSTCIDTPTTIEQMNTPQAKYIPKRSPIIASVRPLDTKSSSFLSLSSSVEKGLYVYSPIPSDDGINDTQLFRSEEGQLIAVFKSAEAHSNLHDNGDAPLPALNHCLTPEEQNIREVAACALDRSGFFSVPLTGLVDITYSGFHSGEVLPDRLNARRKKGSLQQYIHNDGSAEDMSGSRFPTAGVHRLAILDIMLMNGDRHEGNILVQRSPRGCHLIPIDHGYCLPRTLDKCWFCWLTWPQAKVPFGGEELEYITSIDIEKDIKMLRRMDITEDVLENYRIACLLLKHGASRGMTAYDIGAILCRVKGIDKESELEKMLVHYKILSTKMGTDLKVKDMISHMVLSRCMNVERNKKKLLPHFTKSILRDPEEDQQIAMSQYPLHPVFNHRRIQSSPLIMRRI
ncbi:hypothetical protein PROFUN_08776 [Planoprotostelium fungivorum]|uniref:PI3K/PI4K catalytic domain-containing protein n=1 Tax=Planoprotostelium fungivorum TaxID=1890364 RepID=A0A2P6MVP6_9EUKA|nr:hypothetical protein PROFUN_08776 [Planoprotostelium fungivorum]